jgi:hypothetical protein
MEKTASDAIAFLSAHLVSLARGESKELTALMAPGGEVTSQLLLYADRFRSLYPLKITKAEIVDEEEVKNMSKEKTLKDGRFRRFLIAVEAVCPLGSRFGEFPVWWDRDECVFRVVVRNHSWVITSTDR